MAATVPPSPDELLAEVVILRAEKSALSKENQDLKHLVALLQEEVLRLKRSLFGTKSEAMPNANQSPSQTEPNSNLDSGTGDGCGRSDQQPSSKMPPPARAGAGRRALSPDLPRDIETYELPDNERVCRCGCSLTEIGEDISEQVTVIPTHPRVLVRIKKTYACKGCGQTIVTAKAPPSMVRGATYGSPAFFAHLVTMKCRSASTFYRMEQMMNEEGFRVDRTTFARLMGTLGEKCEPLWLLLKEEFLKQDIAQIDETTIQVLKEPGRKAQDVSFMWQYRSAAFEPHPISLLEYQETRSGDHPLHFFGIDEDAPTDRRRYIQVDGYSGYNKLGRHSIRVGCWAHARRKFYESNMALPEKDRGKSLASEVLVLIQGLYAIEKRIAKFSIDDRTRIRQEEARPILEGIKEWLDKQSPDVVPKSLIGRAIAYALSQWDSLVVYIQDGRLAIDNNITEREIKSFVIPRKNFLFTDTPRGAKSLAILHSLVRTAIANGHKPYDYLKYVFTELPKMTRAEEVKRLLPWNLPAGYGKR